MFHAQSAIAHSLLDCDWNRMKEDSIRANQKAIGARGVGACDWRLSIRRTTADSGQ